MKKIVTITMTANGEEELDFILEEARELLQVMENNTVSYSLDFKETT